MFNTGDAVYVSLNIIDPATGNRVQVPGVCAGDQFTGTRENARTGGNIPTQYVNVISFHDVPVQMSKDGRAKKYYQFQQQAANYVTHRTEEVAEIDAFSGTELYAKVEESRLSQLGRVTNQKARPEEAIAAPTPQNAVKTRFNEQVELPA